MPLPICSSVWRRGAAGKQYHLPPAAACATEATAPSEPREPPPPPPLELMLVLMALVLVMLVLVMRTGAGAARWFRVLRSVWRRLSHGDFSAVPRTASRPSESPTRPAAGWGHPAASARPAPQPGRHVTLPGSHVTGPAGPCRQIKAAAGCGRRPAGPEPRPPHDH